MSLLPLVLNELRTPVTLGDIYDHHFGLGLEDFALSIARAPISIPALCAGYLRPWRNLVASDSGLSTVKSDKEFTVHLDVSHFKPEELKVSIDDQGYVKVEGNHEERTDEHGYVSRQFIRRYKLPEDALPDTLASNLSSDGVLTLQTVKKPKDVKAGREIKIVKTKQPALKKEEKKLEEPVKPII